MQQTKEEKDFESEGQVSSSQTIPIRLYAQVTNGLSGSPVCASSQIQQWILILILFNISAAADAVHSSLREMLFPWLRGRPHTLFSSSQPGSSPSPPRDALLPPASVCWRAPHSVPAVSFPLHDLIQSHSFKGSLCADDSQIVSSHQTFPLLRMSSPTCP